MYTDTIFDMAVIGAGPGGYHAAIRGAQLGMKVAIIEQDDGTGIGGLGGVCLNWGCIPSKALLKNAELIYHLKNQANEWGIYFKSPELGGKHSIQDNLDVDISKAVDRSRKVSKQLTQGIAFLLRKNRVTLIQGRGRLLSSTQVHVEGAGIVTAQNIIIATGARPRGLPGIELDGERIISSRQALEMRDKPDAIVIIGASAIGCEFAYYFNAYDIEVLLIEALDRLVPKEDEDVSKELERQFHDKGIATEVAANVKGIDDFQGRPVILYETPDGGEHRFTCDKVLLGVGIQANTEDLGLETVGVKTVNGFISIDEYMRTNITGIYAIGDATGKLPLAHVAFDQGIIAAEAAKGHNPKPLEDYTNIPRCTYCQPEIASIGLTEKEVRNSGRKFTVGRAPYQAAGKSVAIGESAGFVKIIADAETGEILGTHIIGANATELIAEIGMLQYLEGTNEELHRLIHAHPTLSEVIKEAGASITGEAIHF